MRTRLARCSFALMLLLTACEAPPLARHGPTEQTLHARTNPAEDWIETELFFGLSHADGRLISEQDWQPFADELTRAFPDGLTILHADGQYLGEQKHLYREPSRVVIICYPAASAKEFDQRLQNVCSLYVRRFDQESVLRVDRPVRTSFTVRVP